MTILDYINNGFTKLIVPKAMSAIPIEMPKLEKFDEEGDSIGYYSIDDLHQKFGNQYTPIDFGEHHMIVRWAFDDDGIEKADFLTYMESKGLVSHRPIGMKANEIDWGTLSANGFVILAQHELSYLPKQEVEV